MAGDLALFALLSQMHMHLKNKFEKHHSRPLLCITMAVLRWTESDEKPLCCSATKLK